MYIEWDGCELGMVVNLGAIHSAASNILINIYEHATWNSTSLANRDARIEGHSWLGQPATGINGAYGLRSLSTLNP
jgi:hypothetical protein